MPPLKQWFNRRLTLPQTALVLLAVAMVAALIYEGYQFVAARILDARVEATVPIVCDSIRQQRDAIQKAIEAYKVQFGVYPPDHVVNRHEPVVVEPVTNTLLYELAGVLYMPTNQMYQVAGLEPAEVGYVTNFFQCRSFRNCSDKPDQLKHFLAREDVAALQLHDDPDVFVMGFNVALVPMAPELIWEMQASPWHYVCSSPTNNIGKFDLWLELKHGRRVTTIGNWKAVE